MATEPRKGAIDGSQAIVSRAFAFGPFTLLPEQQLLLEGDAPVKIGARALEILLALVEKPGELVGKAELLSRGWPSTFVEPNNLKVNVAALRKALGEPSEHPQYIATVSGRGYRFAAPVAFADGSVAHLASQPRAASPHNIPISITRIIGRDRSIVDLLRQSSESRLLTISGAGGIGKTTVALAVARAALTTFEHGTWLVDLAPVAEPNLVAVTVATTVGLTVHSEDTTAALVAFLRNKNLMLVFDNCEHLIDAVAEIAERLVSATSGVHIIATSREPLRVPAEKIFRLPPLETPPAPVKLTASEALTFPAVELFVERAKEAGEFVLSDADAPLVGDICRELDGIALAIELAATRVSGLGIETLSTALADRFRLLNLGKRTAPARQRTLYATVDWSHQLLTETERTVLQRLSIFASSFDIKAAIAIAAFGTVSGDEVVETIANLVEKSLISKDAIARYRLLETTRAYVRRKIEKGGELLRCSENHARYFRNLLEEAKPEIDSFPISSWVIVDHRTIDDVRAALNWAFSPPVPLPIGISLIVAAIPLWARMSLLKECRAWAERVLNEPKSSRSLSAHDKMALSVALASVLLHTKGPTSQAGSLWRQALRLAQRLGDPEYAVRSFHGLAFHRCYMGDHKEVLKHIASMRQVPKGGRSVAAKNNGDGLDGDRLEAVTLHYMGQHERARHRLKRLLDDAVVTKRGRHLAQLHLDHSVSARSMLAHVLLVQGFFDQARHVSDVVLRDAQTLGHSISIGNVLVLATIPIALYTGDLEGAERCFTLLTDDVAQHGLAICFGSCLRNALLTLRGDRNGVIRLEKAIDDFRSAGFGARFASYLGILAQGLGNIGQMKDAHRKIDMALGWSRKHEDLWCLPELLRVKGELLRREGSTSHAEAQFAMAIKLARRQRARTWDLRASIDLARILHERNKTDEARNLLSSIYRQFSEGFDTADLRTAANMLKNFATSGKACG